MNVNAATACFWLAAVPLVQPLCARVCVFIFIHDPFCFSRQFVRHSLITMWQLMHERLLFSRVDVIPHHTIFPLHADTEHTMRTDRKRFQRKYFFGPNENEIGISWSSAEPKTLHAVRQQRRRHHHQISPCPCTTVKLYTHARYY